MAYNPYSDIETVFNAKTAWNNATTDEERKKQNEIANNARKNLEAYGFGDVAKQISADGANATTVRNILEQYAPPKTNTELISKNNNEVNTKINQLWGTQTSDRDMMTGKYTKLENTAYSNPFETDEAKAILGQYDLKAMQGRENEKASGAASNGGNIDSFAAANALRQQASLINKGQMVVLDAHNNKINNVKGILADLGVFLQNQDKGMQTTIGLQQGEGQRLFENEETAKNNEVARLSEQASVTGYVPNEWTIKNDATYSKFLNPDGTFKKEMENVDIQALINAAKASGDTETAQKLAAIRAIKILNNYAEFGKYANQGDISSIKPQQTEASKQFDKTDSTNRYVTDKNLEGIKDTNATSETIATTESDTAKYGYDKNLEGTKYVSDNDLEGVKNTNESSENIVDKQIKPVTPDNTTYKLTKEEQNTAELVFDQINESLKTHSSNEEGIDLIKYKNGSYVLNLPKGHIPKWWRTQILGPLFKNESLSPDAAFTIALNLGFDEEDITDVAEAYK